VRDETVARNYARTLFELATRHEGVERYQEGIDTVSCLLDENPEFGLFLQTPRVALADKKKVVRKALGGVLPPALLNFLLVVLDKRRQVHADVTVARALDEQALKAVADRLTTLLGRTAIPHVSVKPEILGGIVVRAGDTIFDGSLRRRLDGLRRHLLGTQLRSSGAGASI
jgi:F-type H+-transporting ATPase subunit delta